LVVQLWQSSVLAHWEQWLVSSWSSSASFSSPSESAVFKGWPWVWPVGIIFTIIGLIINLLSIVSNTGAAIIGIIIDIIILWYLFQPQVKAWFKAT
jgi:hypothetical protein